MDQGAWDALVGWIGMHPVAAGGVVFLLSFCDAVVVLGIVVPIAALFLAVGALMGLGTLHPGYTILCAAAGAFCGDFVGYAVGRRYGQGLRRVWPFRNHPGWLDAGEAFMRRHGRKGILIGRHVGAVRPFVPAIVGMSGVPVRQYLVVSVAACVSWAAVYLAPGWLFGASFELLRAVGGRLAVVASALLAALLLTGWLTLRLHRVLAPRAAAAAESMLAWSRRHPFWGRFTAPLVDPNLPESPSVAVWVLVLILCSALSISLIGMLSTGVEPLAWDLGMQRSISALRTPLLDPVLAMISMLGDWQVWLPPATALGGYLLWRRRHAALVHWSAVIGLGWCVVAMMGWWFAAPDGPRGASTASPGFPAVPIVMATIVAGSFAILLARELPGRNRDWPYVLAALWVSTLLFAQLYFGIHELSDALGSVLFGLLWIAVFGVAYRRRRTRPYWIAPPATVFLAALLCSSGWHARHWAGEFSGFTPTPRVERITETAWKQGAWAEWAIQQADGSGPSAWPLDIQYAGSLEQLVESMQATGWSPAYPLGWRGVLLGFQSDLADAELPWLDAAHEGQRTALILARAGAAPGEDESLYLWPTHVDVVGLGPLWVGSRGRTRPVELSTWFRYRARADSRSDARSDWPGHLRVEARGSGSKSVIWLVHHATTRPK